jgi:hypothetical protein
LDAAMYVSRARTAMAADWHHKMFGEVLEMTRSHTSGTVSIPQPKCLTAHTSLGTRNRSNIFCGNNTGGSGF